MKGLRAESGTYYFIISRSGNTYYLPLYVKHSSRAGDTRINKLNKAPVFGELTFHWRDGGKQINRPSITWQQVLRRKKRRMVDIGKVYWFYTVTNSDKLELYFSEFILLNGSRL